MVNVIFNYISMFVLCSLALLGTYGIIYSIGLVMTFISNEHAKYEWMNVVLAIVATIVLFIMIGIIVLMLLLLLPPFAVFVLVSFSMAIIEFLIRYIKKLF